MSAFLHGPKAEVFERNLACTKELAELVRVSGHVVSRKCVAFLKRKMEQGVSQANVIDEQSGQYETINIADEDALWRSLVTGKVPLGEQGLDNRRNGL
jgi:hypothetical protein